MDSDKVAVYLDTRIRQLLREGRTEIEIIQRLATFESVAGIRERIRKIQQP